MHRTSPSLWHEVSDHLRLLIRDRSVLVSDIAVLASTTTDLWHIMMITVSSAPVQASQSRGLT